MPDHGARHTDQQIDEIEKRIAALYDTAYRDIRRKYLAFIDKFKRDDVKMRQRLADGEITKAQYDAWLRGQVFQGRKWNAQLSDIAKTLTDSTIIAADIANEHAENVFAMNANYATYEIEKAGNIDMGFGLYDEDAVRRLVRDNPALLPPSRVDIPREQRWNMDLINRQIGVGIVTGEGIEAIAKRLRRAAVMSANQARTHARTAMTGAQNAGRVEGYKRAEGLGIKLEKEWLATLDGHTRRSHAMLDGQHVPTDQPFKSLLGDIMYPGDPSARPANVYNCRCTLISHLLEHPSQNAMRRPNLQKLGDGEVQKPIKDMTYAEWAGWKTEKKKEWMSSFKPAKTLEEAEIYAQRFVEKYKSKYTGNVSFNGMDLEYANAMNKALTDIHDRYEVKYPIRNIQPINFREKRFKDATMEAAYQWGAGDLFFNQRYFKSAKTYNQHMEEIDSLMKTVLGGIDRLMNKNGTSPEKMRYLQTLKNTGAQCFAQRANDFAEATFIHELGHFLDDRIFSKAIKEKGIDTAESRSKFAQKISGYATTSKPEYIAESFTAFWYGRSDLIDPKLAEVFKEQMK